MRLSVHGPRPRGCRAVSQVQQTHAFSLPHGDLVSPNGFGFWRYEVGNLCGHVARLYGLRSVVVPIEKVAGCVKCAGRQELPWLDAHPVDCTNEGDKTLDTDSLPKLYSHEQISPTRPPESALRQSQPAFQRAKTTSICKEIVDRTIRR